MILRTIGLALIVIWVVLVLLGRGGFVHLLILAGIAIVFIEVLAVIRARSLDR